MNPQLEQIRRGLREPSDRASALELAARVDVEDLKELFPELLGLASFVHGLTARCRDILLRLPRPWLLVHLERQAEPLLAAGGYEEYRALLTLYMQIDPELARRLAERAAQDSDADIQEAGEDFLRQLAQKQDATVPKKATA
jgi:hypothetical protein